MARGRPKNEYWSYESTKMWVHKMARIYGISNYKKWKEFSKEYEIPKEIPPDPQTWYREKYVSDADFLGKRERAWLTYEAAKKYLKDHKIKSYPHFVKWYTKNKPSFIPSNPHRFYGEEWISWGDFLSNERNKREWREYNEAIKWTHKQNIKSYRQWRRLCSAGVIPNDIPKRPDAVYSSQWEGWAVWLGKSISSRLTVQERNTSIIYIIRENDVPNNVYSIGIEKDGIKVLEEWQEVEKFKIIRIYEFDKNKASIFNIALNDNCTVWWESETKNQFLVPNIYGLLGDLDSSFKKITS